MVKLFVGGFPLEATELELVQLISRHATVVTIKIVRDKKTKICKGYAFLEMESQEQTELAIEELDGTMYNGRELKLAIVEEKPPAPVYRKVERQFGVGAGTDIKKKRPRKPM